MGFFKKAVGAVSSVAKKAADPLGLVFKDGQAEPQMQGSTDPRLAQQRDRMMNLYNEYRDNRPKLEQQAITQETDLAKQGLASDLYDVRTAANQRGLLYSGLEQKGEAQAKGKAASNLAKTLAETKQNFQQQEQALEARAFNAGMQTANLDQSRYNSMYNAMLARQQGNQSGVMGLLGGFGTVAGGALGRKG